MEEKAKRLTVTIDARNLECVKNAVRVINNNVCDNHGCVSMYNRELLEALLGGNWHEEYCIGQKYIDDGE